MNEVIEKEIKIENMIYEIRGKQVMLDSDLAKLYNVETKRINEAVKRNLEKFPERFSFVMNEYELKKFEVANCDLKKYNQGGRRTMPRVFTEQGVAMLATILKSKVATEVSIAIMDAFVTMKNYISKTLITNELIENKILEHDKRINMLENVFDSFKEKNNHIFYKGEVYDAYSVMLDIFNRSKENIIIIDNYIDKNILDILAKTEKEVLVITNKYNKIDFDKYKKQYNNVKLKISNEFHDRFIIIDKKYLYHCGASFKDLGKKCFAITKLEEKETLNNLNKYIDNN